MVLSSLDAGYQSGDLSLFPEAIDTLTQLHDVKNNAETVLTQSLTYNGKYVVVADTSGFPDRGIIRIGPPAGTPGNAELIYYDQKSTGIFRNLRRGFAGSRQNQWKNGSNVTAAVMADHHMSQKDAILNIQHNVGLEAFPDDNSLNGILTALETKFYAPKPLFRAFPIVGAPPLAVRFQNFSTGNLVRYLWDFGDGTTSIERNPTHIYQKDGVYSVNLNIITSLGAQGITTKSNYITVDSQQKTPFFYATPTTGYSLASDDPTVFTFVDQTDGDITERYWVFDGPGQSNGQPVPNQSIAQVDPDIHTVTYSFDEPGIYEPSLLIVFANRNLKRVFLKDSITVY